MRRSAFMSREAILKQRFSNLMSIMRLAMPGTLRHMRCLKLIEATLTEWVKVKEARAPMPPMRTIVDKESVA